MIIRDATDDDLPALLDIQNEAIRTQTGIWISREDTLEMRAKWFADRRAAGFPVLMAVEDDGTILGFGSFGTFRPRDGYDLTVEHSVYLFEQARGRGLGRILLEKLIEVARNQGRHVMVAIIDAANQTSVRLHERCGFISAGRIPQAGMKFGQWRDQLTMYLLLDDRPAPPAR